MGHPDEPPEPPLIHRNRNGDEHITNCGTGYLPGRPRPDWSTYSNIHHIVCISCMADGTIEAKVGDKDQFEFIKKCLAFTNWNINAGPNCVGLPKKAAYVDTLASPGWGVWPCHQVDHPSYLDKVSVYLNDTIWLMCQNVAQDCKVTGEAIATALTQASKFWLAKLSNRPTAAAWATRKQNPKTWYIPFSMDQDNPSERKPPPDWTGLSASSMLSRLSELFAML